MPEVLMDGLNGRRLVLSDRRPRDTDDIWRYRASLVLREGYIQTDVWDCGEGLARFLRELADAWSGFDGVKEFHSLEGQLSMSCRHDGTGTVRCVVTLAGLEPPTWSTTAELDFGAGAHLDRIALDARGFVGTP